MADPELGHLPGLSSSYLDIGNKPETSPAGSGRSSPSINTGNGAGEQEERENGSTKFIDDIDEPESPNENSPIVHRYLTFETELPTPINTRATLNGDSSEPPPELPSLVKFTSPFEWSSSRKSFITWLSCIATAITAATAGAYTPAAQQMQNEWDVGTVPILVGVTTFTTGFAFAPMVLAPFSEINGRYPVFIATGILFAVCQVGCAVTQSYAGMLIARFFSGVGGSTFSTMVGGVVSDIYHTADRNTPMALFSGAALFGTGLGPLVCGFIAEYTSWRWIFWLQTILCGTIMVAIALFFQETRGSILLSRKARKLNKWYERREDAGYYGVTMPSESDPEKSVPQRIRWKVKSDEERSSLATMIYISLYRPFHLLLTEPVVFWFSLWVSFSWAVLYLTLAAIPLVFTTNHGFSISEASAVFAAMCVGALLSTVLSIYQERLAARLGKLSATPEGRLYFPCVQSGLLPVGLFMFGWTCAPSVPWIVAAIAIAVATMGIFSVYLAVFNYLADTYHRYASSALAAQSFCRNILGGVFPLITTQMYRGLTFGGASSLLGGIAILLTLVPWILVFYGPRIRARSKFASEIMHSGA
ncbi:major facilitator superfamily domain-containing protein [Lineolata rhizophorae]|uniref:Major facilitator superfamily domain-containing protein n=1 Tax=Lineolata rhizophorae TaxID=578093 RepID=A0A6A6NRD5_9PEZI|nr:major facilitator superfamily domain-containing protein [Lineolata rhizophorae]